MRPEYTHEFRDRAVELSLQSDRPIGVIAEELGVKLSTLYGWRRDYRRKASTAAASTASSRLSQAEEITALRKELKRVSEERDILKKAVGYFANPSGK
jgi:transposase